MFIQFPCFISRKEYEYHSSISEAEAEAFWLSKGCKDLFEDQVVITGLLSPRIVLELQQAIRPCRGGNQLTNNSKVVHYAPLRGALHPVGREPGVHYNATCDCCPSTDHTACWSVASVPVANYQENCGSVGQPVFFKLRRTAQSRFEHVTLRTENAGQILGKVARCAKILRPKIHAHILARKIIRRLIRRG